MNELPGLEPRREVGRFGRVVASFRDNAPWLTPVLEPQVVALEEIAEQLDNGARTAALLAQFTLTHRALLKMAPGVDPAEGEGDEVERALGEFQ